ncbi:protein ABHD13 [Cloeon dipterum]|uniref:protein ABHD13 n=1 Tax=Cloeon dipterum TaxID=197152 RepID=UPI00322087FC
MARLMMLKAAVLLRLLGKVAMGCWAWSSSMLLGCVLLYWVYGGFFAFLLLCIAITGILYHAEDHLLFHPEQPSHSRVFVPVPSMFGLPYENLFIRSLDGTLLHMFFIRQQPQKATTAPTILFLHGNAGNMGHRLHNALGLYHQLGCNILLVDYRGYGMSQGSPSEEGLYLDAQAALYYLSSRKDINHNEIIVFGRSLGGAVAIDLVCRVDCAPKIWCAIVENSFTSIPDMAHILLGSRIIKSLPLFCYKNKFPSYDKAPCMARPALFISGLADTLVPPRMMTTLSQRCGSIHKQLLCFETGSHNETWTCHGYYHAISTFLNDLRERNNGPVAQAPLPASRPPVPDQASL